MRAITPLALILLLPLGACGPKAIALPDDPIEQAATCGVVTAAAARQGSTDMKAPLPFDAQGRILHYAMLAAAKDGRFESDRAVAVVDRMPKIEAAVTGSKWAELVEPCAAAYPPTTVASAITLPADRPTAQAGCFMLANFLTSALRSQESSYRDDMPGYDALERRLDMRMGAAAKGADYEAVQATRQKALAALVTLGPPMRVMDACLAQYPG